MDEQRALEIMAPYIAERFARIEASIANLHSMIRRNSSANTIHQIQIMDKRYDPE